MAQIALLINPWIYDFSAYDLWMRPIGLLRVASYLRRQGFKVVFFDCLDSRARRDDYGCGKFTKRLVEKSEVIKNVQRAFYRYGVDTLRISDRPDIVNSSLEQRVFEFYPRFRVFMMNLFKYGMQGR